MPKQHRKYQWNVTGFGSWATPNAHRGYTGAVALTASQRATLIVQDLTYLARDTGTSGNSTSIEYVDSVSASHELATVVGTDISVAIQSGVSTAAQIRRAVLVSVAAMRLIDVQPSGTEAAAQTAAGATPLAGGTLVDTAYTLTISNGIDPDVVTVYPTLKEAKGAYEVFLHDKS